MLIICSFTAFRSADELSDLSENEYDSMSSGDEGEYLVEEYMRELETREEMADIQDKFLLSQVSESGIQTDENEFTSHSQSLPSTGEFEQMVSSNKKAANQDIEDVDLSPEELQKRVEIRLKNVEGVLRQLGASGEESENGPKFVKQPTDVTVCEGEVARFQCVVEGAQPIGKFHSPYILKVVATFY